MNNAIEFKGFKIEFISNGLNIDSGRYFVSPANAYNGINPNGYATMGGAKGAITKFVNHAATLPPAATEVTNAAGVELKQDASVVVVNAGPDAEAVKPSPIVTKCASKEDADRATVEAKEAESNHLMAQLRYHGFTKPVHSFNPRLCDYRSRNKREGHTAERLKWATKHMSAEAKNRKQRKAAKLAYNAKAGRLLSKLEF
jgi:hypothetical protein